jgi:tetratricopeptide (TPR) repeat protein
LAAFDRAIEFAPEYAFAWKNRGRTKLDLGIIMEAIKDLRRAIHLNSIYVGAYESLVEALTLAGAWDEASELLAHRYRLPGKPENPGRSVHVPDILLALFRVSADRAVWTQRVSQLADLAAEANALTQLGDALVRSLTKKAYTEASADTLDAWADVWRTVAERHPDLSLATRLFGFGVRYLRTKDERVLLDLVQEERAILRDLYGLDDGTDEG